MAESRGNYFWNAAISVSDLSTQKWDEACSASQVFLPVLWLRQSGNNYLSLSTLLKSVKVKCSRSGLWWSDDFGCSAVALRFCLPHWETLTNYFSCMSTLRPCTTWHHVNLHRQRPNLSRQILSLSLSVQLTAGPSWCTLALNPCNTFVFICLQVIQFALRDYIQYWYYTLSEDESFLLEIRQTLQNALVQFCTRYDTRVHLCSTQNHFIILFCAITHKVQRGGLAALLHHSPGWWLCHSFTSV